MSMSIRTFIIVLAAFFAFSSGAFAQQPGANPANPQPGANPSVSPTPQSGTASTPSNPAGPEVTLYNPLSSGSSPSSFVTSILALVTRIGAIVVVFMLVYVGFLFVTAQGNEGKITQARTALLWTVVGALILLGAQAIAAGVQATVTALSA